MYILGNGSITLAFDRERGTIERFDHERLNIRLVGERRLAENFRVLLPLPHLRGHYLYGKDQKLSDCAIDGTRAVLTWERLRSKEGEFDISLSLIVELDGDDAAFRVELDNRTPYTVEEVFTPALGGLYNPEERDDWIFQYHQFYNAHERPFYQAFPHVHLGDRSPIWFHQYDSLPWCSLYDRKARRGVYIGNHDLEPRVSMIAQQLFPNFAFDARWPEADEVEEGQPIGSMLAWVSFPFAGPMSAWEGPPIVFHFHEGIWYEAADYYRSWFDRHFPFDKSDSWLYHEDAWQSTIISYPDDARNYTFKDLPRIAATAKASGINVIQIDGWDIGGIDRNYPDYSPDPLLGTPEELEEAIRACRDMGVRFLMFANIQVAHLETEWFKNELQHYRLRDYWGNALATGGWGYHTALGYTEAAAPKVALMDLTSPFKEIMLKQIRGMIGRGPSGLQFDKTNALHHMTYGAGPDTDLAFRRELIDVMKQANAIGRQVDPDFRVANEAWLDKMIPHADAAYTRFFSKDRVPVFEYVFPEYRMTNCIMAIDYGLVNNCIRYGHVINMEAGNLHGIASDEPKLARYIAEVLRIRRSLKDVLWYGRLAEPLGLATDNDRTRRSLFRSADGTRHAAVLTHFERSEQKVTLTAPALKGCEASVYRPFRERETVLFPCELAIGVNELAIVVW